MKPQVEKEKSENYNYAQPNLLAACVNDCSKVKLHELFRSLLKLICLVVDFSNDLDQRITDLQFDTKV